MSREVKDDFLATRTTSTRLLRKERFAFTGFKRWFENKFAMRMARKCITWTNGTCAWEDVLEFMVYKPRALYCGVSWSCYSATRRHL